MPRDYFASSLRNKLRIISNPFRFATPHPVLNKLMACGLFLAFFPIMIVVCDKYQLDGFKMMLSILYNAEDHVAVAAVVTEPISKEDQCRHEEKSTLT